LRPGTPEWEAFILAATVVKTYTPYLLGTEATLDYVGPEWFGFKRVGKGYTLIVYVNASDLDRELPGWAVPDVEYTKTEVLTTTKLLTTTKAILRAGATIPAGGVVILLTG
jgi:hypothetical protein